MGQIKDILNRLQPLSRGKQALKAFVTATRSFTLGSDYQVIPEVFEYRRQIEPTTGLSKHILLARAMSDLAAPDGQLIVSLKKLGGSPLASFFEFEIDTDKRKAVILGVNLNLEAHIKHLGGDDFYVSMEDGYSVVNALVEAEAAIEMRRKRGEDKVILHRDQVDGPIGEFINQR